MNSLLKPITQSSFTNLIWNHLILRTRMKYAFPRPREVKRVVHQGYFTRLATPAGRKILMRKILKGRHCLGH
uniref:39S ribosomal protein L34, mitochondrial n=1 Tax=Trichogramma kaykai TaxID=54128 RepID=A0ABD2XJH4_9HYME